MPIVDPVRVIGAVTAMFDCLAANKVFSTAVVVYADRSIPTVVPDNVTGAVTEIKSCFADKSTSKTLFVRLRGLEVVKLFILVANAVFIWAVVL